MSQDDAKYTQPELRARLKQEIQAGSKGGRAGQWSARKSQLLARAYEQAGGGYHGEKDEAARQLDRWTDEDWQTETGGDARHGHHMHRYLPRAVWERLTDAQKREAEASKDRAKGQRVEWPDAVKRAMQAVRDEGAGSSKADLLRQAAQAGIRGRSRMTKAELAEALQAAK